MGHRWGEGPATKGIDEAASLKRIAWAFGCSPKDSEEEERLLGLLLRKLEADERELANVDAKLRAAAEHVGAIVRADPDEAWVPVEMPDMLADLGEGRVLFVGPRDRLVDGGLVEAHERMRREVETFVEAWDDEDAADGNLDGPRIAHVDGLRSLVRPKRHAARDVRVTFTDPATGVEHCLESVSGELVAAGPAEALPAFVADMRAPDFTGAEHYLGGPDPVCTCETEFDEPFCPFHRRML